jgi:hypothetical protein
MVEITIKFTKGHIMQKKDTIVRKILKEHIQLFSPPSNVLASKHEQADDSKLR